MAHVVAFDTARAGWAKDPIGRREDLVRLGLWLFLATVTMLFAAFTSAYIVRRSGHDWRHVALPAVLWVNTGILALSSVAVESARSSGTRARWGLAGVAFGFAVALGMGFLGGQVLAWRQLIDAGVYLSTNPHSSFFFMLTGAHAIHVVAAIAVLAWGALKTWSGVGRRNPRAWAASIGLCRTFWHYLGAVWIYLFVLMSVL